MIMSSQIRSTWKDANRWLCIQQKTRFTVYIQLFKSTQAATKLVYFLEWQMSHMSVMMATYHSTSGSLRRLWRVHSDAGIIFCCIRFSVCCTVMSFALNTLFISHPRRAEHKWIIVSVPRLLLAGQSELYPPKAARRQPAKSNCGWNKWPKKKV